MIQTAPSVDHLQLYFVPFPVQHVYDTHDRIFDWRSNLLVYTTSSAILSETLSMANLRLGSNPQKLVHT